MYVSTYRMIAPEDLDDSDVWFSKQTYKRKIIDGLRDVEKKRQGHGPNVSDIGVGTRRKSER